MEEILTLFSNYAFPMACCVAMFLMWKQECQNHKEESEKWVQAINNNTATMNRILEKLE